MYELQKNGKVFTSKFVGTGPSSYKKKNLPGRGLTKVETRWSSEFMPRCRHTGCYWRFERSNRLKAIYRKVLRAFS